MKEIELLLARNVDPDDPMIDQYVQHERRIRVSIRGGAPGKGKSCKLFQDWKNLGDFRKIYFSHSHSFLAEQATRVEGKVRHLKGLRLLCPCLQNEEHKNSVIMKLVSLKFPNKYLCSVCKEIGAYPTRKCPYQQQFRGLKNFPVIVAPIEYAMYTSVLDKYQPHYIAVDDCLTRIKLHPSRIELSYALSYLSELAGQPIKSEHPFRELISRPDYNSFIKRLDKVYRKNVKRLAKEVKDNTKPTSYDPNFLIPPAEIDTYCKQAQVHGFRDRFATPALFPLFDYVFNSKTEDDEAQLKIIEAIPKMEFLNSLATRYQAEENITVNFESDGFEPKFVDRGSIVYRYMGKEDAWYPATSSIKNSSDTRRNISRVIAQILQEFHNNLNLKIGIVRPKNVFWEQFVPMGFTNVKALHFGDLRGKNSLEDCDVLFVIGTYCINKETMEQDFSDWYARDPSTMKVVEKEKHGDFYHYKDKDVEILRWMREDYEMYQAIHRIRPLLAKKQVYVFGVVPKEISKDGLKVIEIEGGYEKTLNRKKWLENYMEIKLEEPAIFVEEKFGKEFNISEKWAYREVKKIVANSEHLKFEQHRGRWLVYVE